MPPRSPVTIDRFVPTLTVIRADVDAAARAATPGCVLTTITAIGGAVLLAYGFTWDPGWYRDPATLAGLAAYVVAVSLVWKVGIWWATPAATIAERSMRRLESDVLQPLVAEMRPGARYEPRAEAPQDTLARSRLVGEAPFTSRNQICWRTSDLALEMFELKSIKESSGEFSSTRRSFEGLLAWADLPTHQDDFYVLVRSRHEFAHQVAGPRESAALEGIWVQASIADGRVWVGIDADKNTWFLGYPNCGYRFPQALDDGHVAGLEQHLTIVEDVATALARAVGAWESRASS